jgi:superfamily II RNA helicase
MSDTLLQIPDAMTAPVAWPPAEPLALPTKYELDPFQKHAVLGIHAGDHVFVCAKTGSGKTFVGEYLCARAIAAGKRVFYTTPIKSLSNQKYHDLKKMFPEATVGILTGDIKMCPDAQIVVMTAEILRNLFYKRGTATEGVGLTAAVSLEGVVGVVMDEVHYIQDPDRGHVWEESLILCPRDLQLVLLSATLPSAANLAGWLARLHGRRTWLLETTYRVVPLVHGILGRCGSDSNGWSVRPLLDTRGGWVGDTYTGWLREQKAVADAAADHRQRVKDQMRGGSGGQGGQYWSRERHDAQREAVSTALRASKVRVESPTARLQRTVAWLETHGQLPALFFVFSRRECERLSACLTASYLDSSDSASATHIFDFHLSRHRATLEKSPQYHTVRDLAARGIAFHHSGLQPLLKEIVEHLFARGFIKVLFATETFAVGLNMPTKTVVFLELEKWSDGGQRRLLRPDEYIQMAGRAGRRGLDKQGLVLYEPLREPVSSLELKGLLTGALPALQSRMRFGYDFILRWRLTGGSLPLVENSYWAAQQGAVRAGMERELAAVAARSVGARSALSDAVVELFRTRVALEREVAESVNAKRRKAQQALMRWEMEAASAIPKGQQPFLEKKWAEWLEAERDVAGVSAALATPMLSLAAEEDYLTRWGFLGADGSLTELGVCATEVNEGHGLLMPWLAASGHMDSVGAEEIPCVLAAFLREGSGRDEEEAPAWSENGLSVEAVGSLEALRAQTRVWTATTNAGPQVREDYWSLSRLWVSVAARWMAGEGITQIAAATGLFEGNVQRGLLRIANLLEEWGAVATVRRDLATLERLASITFLRGEVVVDSIYLRL